MEDQEPIYPQQRKTKRRASDRCPDDICNEHSGIKTTQYIIIVGIMINVGLLSWDKFVTSADIKENLVGLRSDISSVMKAQEKLEIRVSEVERIVYSYNPKGVR
jgi:hypothetical protein